MHLTTNPTISQGRHTTNNVHAAQHAQHTTVPTSSGVIVESGFDSGSALPSVVMGRITAGGISVAGKLSTGSVTAVLVGVSVAVVLPASCVGTSSDMIPIVK
ncbi:hypothetical protein AG4045_009208 [Apium graveolens]|uniref:Uncharacterized protein n=1 Tax=Apium graveolens TaxID=4045 RepID=A0A6L5B717_APIGR|nr:hypothetical protein AG4045_009208 [Apium graveolens]